jgi:hypothetical protein
LPTRDIIVSNPEGTMEDKLVSGGLFIAGICFASNPRTELRAYRRSAPNLRRLFRLPETPMEATLGSHSSGIRNVG